MCYWCIGIGSQVTQSNPTSGCLEVLTIGEMNKDSGAVRYIVDENPK